MQRQFLVVPVHGFLRVHEPRAFSLALRATSRLRFLILENKSVNIVWANSASGFGKRALRTALESAWNTGPKMNPHFPQSYITSCSCGKTPVRRVTTPDILIKQFKCACRMSRIWSTIGKCVMRTKISLVVNETCQSCAGKRRCGGFGKAPTRTFVNALVRRV